MGGGAFVATWRAASRLMRGLPRCGQWLRATPRRKDTTISSNCCAHRKNILHRPHYMERVKGSLPNPRRGSVRGATVFDGEGGGIFARDREDSPARSIHASNRARPPLTAPPPAPRRATSRQTPRRPALQPICNHQIPNHIADEPHRRPLAHSDASALGSPLPRRANSGLGSPETPPILGIAFLSAAHSRQALQPLPPPILHRQTLGYQSARGRCAAFFLPRRARRGGV